LDTAQRFSLRVIYPPLTISRVNATLGQSPWDWASSLAGWRADPMELTLAQLLSPFPCVFLITYRDTPSFRDYGMMFVYFFLPKPSAINIVAVETEVHQNI
jgi:hypothetical protein